MFTSLLGRMYGGDARTVFRGPDLGLMTPSVSKGVSLCVLIGFTEKIQDHLKFRLCFWGSHRRLEDTCGNFARCHSVAFKIMHSKV
jgi:hypothetical protein